MDLFQTLQTGAGAWNPLLWLVALGVALVVALAIRSRGRKDFREGVGRKPFISGNEEPENGGGHVPASNLYWGFLESLKSYYARVMPLHTSIPTDYVAWLLGVMAFMLVVVLTV